MEPLLWWWRWWAGVDPNLNRTLAEAKESIERLQTRVERLSSELEARDTQITALQRDLEESDGERSRLRSRVTELEQATAETDQLRTRITELEQATAETDQLRAQVEELRRAEPAGEETPPEDEPAKDAAVEDREPDVAEARSILGSRFKPDELTMIEGIGPKIAGQLQDAGITTWRQLSEADPSELRRMLSEAGPRFRMHDPANWPAQAALLASGRWQEYKDLTTKLREQRGG